MEVDGSEPWCVLKEKVPSHARQRFRGGSRSLVRMLSDRTSLSAASSRASLVDTMVFAYVSFEVSIGSYVLVGELRLVWRRLRL